MRAETLRLGLSLAAVLLLALTAFALVGVRRARGVPCGCFGPFLHETFGPGILVRNLLLLGLVWLAWPASGPPTLVQGVAAALVVASVLVFARVV